MIRLDNVKVNDDRKECTRVRESYGLKQNEVAQKIGISEPVYSLHERQKRNASINRMEKFYYEVNHACKQLLDERIEKSKDLELNTYQQTEEFDNIEDEIDAELQFELHYVPITDEIYFDILLKYIFRKKTLVRAAAEYGVCEQELENRLIKDGHKYEKGDNWERLVK